MVAEFFPSSPEHVGQANYSGITQSGVWRNRLTACVCVNAKGEQQQQQQYIFCFKPFKKTKQNVFINSSSKKQEIHYISFETPISAQFQRKYSD